MAGAFPSAPIVDVMILVVNPNRGAAPSESVHAPLSARSSPLDEDLSLLLAKIAVSIAARCTSHRVSVTKAIGAMNGSTGQQNARYVTVPQHALRSSPVRTASHGNLQFAAGRWAHVSACQLQRYG